MAKAKVSSEQAPPVAPHQIRSVALAFVAVLVGVYVALLTAHGGEIVRFFSFVWLFAPIGVFGAIIASSTGTGGGVVFVPAFNLLSAASEMGTIPMEISIDPVKTIGISFMIQCFGMSVGSAVWIVRYYGGGKVPAGERIDGHSFLAICFTVLATTIPSLLLTQHLLFANVDGKSLLTAFKWFSLILGIVLLVFTWALKKVKPYRFRPERLDLYWLLGLGVVGGIITALFSVGVGELVAVYLILRKFPTTASIAVAVVVSVVTVIAGVGYHVASGNVVWAIALTAIPGAMIGGFAARIFALWLGPLWLKTFASVWIILSSAFLIFGKALGLIA